MFKFIHAADIHLDSPLRGLERYEAAPVDEIRQATRRAFENLVRLAIEESVGFVLLAGDLYDGDWKDYNTGLYFISQMAKLRDAQIPVFLIAGNHDAANKMTRALPPLDNVRILSPQRPETVRIDDYNVAIHGQGFAMAAVTEDLSKAYPAADPGCFNIGMLHTCATGRDGHERYAPCTLDGLRSKGYDYWALGHVHNFELLSQDPWIVFPGNIQGRHIRESGPKGCMLVSVADNHQATPDRRPLDVFRWETCQVDATAAQSGSEVVDRLTNRLRDLVRASEGLPLAVRVEVTGACRAHQHLAAESHRWTNEVRSAAVDAGSGAVWIEKIKWNTSLPAEASADWSDGPLGELIQYIEELRVDRTQLSLLGSELADLKKKLPPELSEGGGAMDLESPDALLTVLDDVREVLAARLLGKGEPE